MSPVGLAIIGGAGALICARLKRQRVAKWLGWLTVAWLWLWMTPIMTWIVGVPLLKEFGVGEDAVSFLDARTTEEEAKGLEKLGYKKYCIVGYGVFR